MRRALYGLQYLLGRVPWDTNVTPPEVVAVIEEEKLAPGQALDLGCGTGTNAIYLAQHGWQVNGIDFVPRAIRRARRKARQSGVEGQVTFHVGDVAQLEALDLPPINFALDIGCFHSLPSELRDAYAVGLDGVAAPGAVYLLYAFQPRQSSVGRVGVTADEVAQLFAPGFRVVNVEYGEDVAGDPAASAWYRLERTG